MSSETMNRASDVGVVASEPALEPEERFELNDAISTFTFTITDHQGYEKRLNLAGTVNSRSRVFVSIAELGFFGGQVKPFMGLASMEVHNVVPHDDGIVIVRGLIGWDRDLNARLSVMVAS